MRSVLNRLIIILKKAMESLKSLILPLLCIFKRTTTIPIWPAEKPLISVIIPCYNHGHYLSEAVESILAQTWQNFEIIIVNDGSEDENTITELQNFSHPKTRILTHEKNLGLPATRNTGIKQANGKYVFCLDADDKIHSTFLEKAILLMESNSAIGFVYSWVQVFGDEQRVWYTPQYEASELIYHNQLTALAVFRRLAWEQVGGYREEMRLGYEDWEFWIRLARNNFHGYRIPEKLTFVRRIGRSFVHAAMDRHNQLMGDIQRYNPDVYEDTTWLDEIRSTQREKLVNKPFINLDNYNIFLPYNKHILWVNTDVTERFREVLPALSQKTQIHKGDFVFISYKWLDEDIMDSLYTKTAHIYILPNFLPPCMWKEFVELKQSNFR